MIEEAKSHIGMLRGVGPQCSEPDPRPFPIYRNSRGWPAWHQRWREAWWIVTGQHTLHKIWQAGYDHGSIMEIRRTLAGGR